MTVVRTVLGWAAALALWAAIVYWMASGLAGAELAARWIHP